MQEPPPQQEPPQQEPPPQQQPPPPPPAPVPQPMPMQAPGVMAGTPTNTLALVSLISGIVSWFAVPILGGIVAVITGHMAKGQIRRTGEQGDLFATIGLVLGYVHLAVVLLIGLIFVLVLIGTFAAIRTTSG